MTQRHSLMLGALVAALAVTPASTEQSNSWPPTVIGREEAGPIRTPQEELATFVLPPGYRAELVAAEPLVQDPVVIEFDPDGRLWVVEMPAFQQGINPSDEQERQPIGRIVVLEDTNDDGRMDKRTVFKDGLVLPRAIKVMDSGVLVGEPPYVWLFKDTDGDLKADTQVMATDTYGRRENSIEHNANALFWGMDNWMHVSEYETGLRYKNGTFEARRSLSRGQWGATQDDGGRIYRNSNSSILHVDVIPTPYYQRHPGLVRTRGSYESLGGVNGEVNAVWSIRTNRGANRGYQRGILREDGRLADVTGAGGPLIFRGDRLPKDVYGNAFVAEPVGNVVIRLIIDTTGPEISARKAYANGEFLASTDERFRPVYLTDGPDGTLYIADLYRGIIQHKIYITEYLRDHIVTHKLVDPIGKGRIFRIVHESMPRGPRVTMSKETTAQLVGRLADANGWRRDAAQRILVERRDARAVAALRRLATTATDYRARLHALWTLDGMDAIQQATVVSALTHPHRDVRIAAVRIAERWAASPTPALKRAVLARVADRDAMVRRQVAASLGAWPAADRDPAVATLLSRHGNDAMTADAALSGLRGAEIAVLQRLLATKVETVDVASSLTLLAAAVLRGGQDDSIQSVLQWVGDTARPVWQRSALVAGGESALLGRALPGTGPIGRGSGASIPPDTCPTCPGGRAGPGGVQVFAAPAPAAPVVVARAAGPGPGAAPTAGRGAGRGGGGPMARLRREPAIARTAANDTTEFGARVNALLARVVWPGKPGVETVAPLTADEEKRFEAGAVVYRNVCQACHQSDGRGADKIASSLIGSPLALGAPDVAARAVIGGKEGAVGLMPPLGGVLSDEQVAAVLTYVRREWGQTGAPVVAADAQRARAASAGRSRPWSHAELLALAEQAR